VGVLDTAHDEAVALVVLERRRLGQPEVGRARIGVRLWIGSVEADAAAVRQAHGADAIRTIRRDRLGGAGADLESAGLGPTDEH
jgi:hypothetical protein